MWPKLTLTTTEQQQQQQQDNNSRYIGRTWWYLLETKDRNTCQDWTLKNHSITAGNLGRDLWASSCLCFTLPSYINCLFLLLGSSQTRPSSAIIYMFICRYLKKNSIIFSLTLLTLQGRSWACPPWVWLSQNDHIALF